MRRAAADVGLVRLMIYYGTSERHEGHGHSHEDSSDSHLLLLPKTMAVLDADPFFTYAALYGSGALAFNLNRPDEALRLLEYALARDPDNFQLRAYIAAVGFHKKGDLRAVSEALEPALSYPDCPAMIKHLMAVLYKRLGKIEKSRALYTELLEHPDYAPVARQQLDKL